MTLALIAGGVIGVILFLFAIVAWAAFLERNAPIDQDEKS